MQLLLDGLEPVQTTLAAYRTACSEFSTSFSTIQSGIKIARGKDVVEYLCENEGFFSLREGSLTLSGAIPQSEADTARALVVYEPGDIINGSWFLGGYFSLSSDFAIVVDRYSPAQEVLPGSDSRLSNLTVIHGRIWMHLCHHLAERLAVAQIQRPPDLRHFQPGDQIITRGATDNEVFTLLEGGADAVVDGVKVGEILPDEIFGAIAALAGVPRTASVIATHPSIALVLPREEFLQLLNSRPLTVMKLIQDMARALAKTNERLVAIQKNLT